jgi:protein SCO1
MTMFARRISHNLNQSVNRSVLQYSSKVPKPNHTTRGPVTFASLVFLGIAGGAISIYYNTKKEEKMKEVTKNVVTVGKPSLGGPWALIDHNGVPRTDASFRGKFTLLYFGFTHCPDLCPSELVKVGKILNALGN